MVSLGLATADFAELRDDFALLNRSMDGYVSPLFQFLAWLSFVAVVTAAFPCSREFQGFWRAFVSKVRGLAFVVLVVVIPTEAEGVKLRITAAVNGANKAYEGSLPDNMQYCKWLDETRVDSGLITALTASIRPASNESCRGKLGIETLVGFDAGRDSIFQSLKSCELSIARSVIDRKGNGWFPRLRRAQITRVEHSLANPSSSPRRVMLEDRMVDADALGVSCPASVS